MKLSLLFISFKKQLWVPSSVNSKESSYTSKKAAKNLLHFSHLTNFASTNVSNIIDRCQRKKKYSTMVDVIRYKKMLISQLHSIFNNHHLNIVKSDTEVIMQWDYYVGHYKSFFTWFFWKRQFHFNYSAIMRRHI